MAPRKITTVGTWTPRPRSIGLRTLSESATTMHHTVKTTAPAVPMSEKAQAMIGSITTSVGSWMTAKKSTISAQSPAPGTPATMNPSAASRDWISAVPRMPWATLWTVVPARLTNSSPRSPATRWPITRAALRPDSSLESITPAITIDTMKKRMVMLPDAADERTNPPKAINWGSNIFSVAAKLVEALFHASAMRSPMTGHPATDSGSGGIEIRLSWSASTRPWAPSTTVPPSDQAGTSSKASPASTSTPVAVLERPPSRVRRLV